MELYQLLRIHPDWSTQKLATTLGYSLSWVKKWRKRLREAAPLSFQSFSSHSRAPKTSPRQIDRDVREQVLALREGLREVYQVVPGPKRILYHLHQDKVLSQHYRL